MPNAKPWSKAESRLFTEFLTQVEGPPYDTWPYMAAKMNNAAKERNLDCMKFTSDLLRGHYRHWFPNRHLEPQKRVEWEEGVMRDSLRTLEPGWTFKELAKAMDQTLVTRGISRHNFARQGVTYAYKEYYGDEAAENKDRFPQRLQSVEQQHLGEGEQTSEDQNMTDNLQATAGESSTTAELLAPERTRSRYLTWDEMI